MKRWHIQGRTLAMIGVLIPLLALFVYVAIRSGPLAPVLVTATTVENRSIMPSLFGIGIMEARYTYRIGPTFPGRVKHVDVDVGHRVKAGQLLGDMDPVDLDDRVAALEAALDRAESLVLVSDAQAEEAKSRTVYATTQTRRYEQLVEARTESGEVLDAKQQELDVAEASLASARANQEAARHEWKRVSADLEALAKQRANLRLVAPTDGLVVSRNAEPGSTVVAGQSVIELVDPESLWVNVRFDQLSAAGLRPDLPAQIVLRSEGGRELAGRVVRVEPLADSVTEELLAKVALDSLSDPLPPVGELAEVTVTLPALPTAPTLPNACVLRVDGHLGVWLIQDGMIQFVSVKTGAYDLDGRIQILDGLQPGDDVVVYSQRMLNHRSHVKVVERLSEGLR